MAVGIIFGQGKIPLWKTLPMEKYSSWWRGAPAKGVGRVTGARVRVSPSAPGKAQGFFLCAFSFCIYEFVWRDSNSSSIFLQSKKGHKINCSQSEHDGLKTRRVSPSAPGKVSGFSRYLFSVYWKGREAQTLRLPFAGHFRYSQDCGAIFLIYGFAQKGA